MFRILALSCLLLPIFFCSTTLANLSEQCHLCHEDKALKFSESIHKDFECTSCHDVKSIPHEKIPPVKCEICHGNIKNLYEKSVHGRGRIKSGLNVAPNCNDCHSAHDVKLHSNPRSITYKTNIPNICGRCHTGILEEFKESIHGKLLLNKKNIDAPACTDCHGVHIIAESFQTRSKTFSSNVPKTCASCHAVGTLMTKYGIKTEQVETYKETFHGRANIYGQIKAANCASCHGVHNIKDVKDPMSQVSKQNLPKTCGKCHKDALNNPNFSKVIMHLKPSEKIEPIVFYIRILYTILILSIIGGMIIYNILDFISRIRERK